MQKNRIMLIYKEYVEKMGYPLNGEMQLLSRKKWKMGDKKRKIEVRPRRNSYQKRPGISNH